MGVGVLVLSLALTGCGGKKKNKKHKSGSGSSHSRTIGGATGGGSAAKGGGSLSGAQDAKAVLPPTDTMPAALRNVGTELHSRAKAPSVCKAPGGKCKNAVANGQVGYHSNDKGEGASYDVIVYRDDRAAQRAFAAWDSYVRDNKHELKVVDGPKQGADSVAFGFTRPAEKNTLEIVILQGKYVGTLKLRDNSGPAEARQDLGVLAEVYATRLLQATRDEAPSATAANVKV
ncbi:hypothetical protein GCM10009837_23730 [Streptomyces durmitorensis]|uniref:Lipoprotein n=1 Tax=Streptomyces durmitorensis TaxID=319947 RepID=A0ABY4PMH2_9ACTN|nr:hypothetical protein [Streptomyces durmitorensis]UQT55005.1 hypothetical protein M4V62_07805 [Streptomyces durmitorensis]